MIIPEKSSNIILIGFMGTGKTSIGKYLSFSLNKDFIDIDEEIEKKEKMPINEIFEKKGGDYFREIETEVLKSLKKTNNSVIATGGGIIKKKENRDFLKEFGFIIHLKASFDEILKRVEGTHTRPLLNNIDKKACIKSLWNEREELYNIADFEVNTHYFEFSEIIDFLKKIYLNSFLYNTSRNQTVVNISKNSISQINMFLSCLNAGKRNVLVITDNNVNRLYKNFIEKISDNVINLEPGESVKSLENAEYIYDYLIKNKFNRDDIVIAVGGGTVCDLTGFVGSTFKRGVKTVLIPTTLLSMVDASVGGKTAVNFKNTKNIIGTFYQPDMILVDSIFLKTLNNKDALSGKGELIKYNLLCGNIDYNENNDSFDELIKKALIYKSDVVEKDELDLIGKRALLNLGHSFAHIIESLSEYNVSHGIAVCDGIYYAYKMAFILKKISSDLSIEFLKIRKQAGFDLDVFDFSDYETEKILNILKNDKKNSKGKINLVLPYNSEEGKIDFKTFSFDIEEIEKNWSKL